MENSVIKNLELNYSEVRSVVENWYLSTPTIFQSESGLDLEEIVTNDYQLDYYEGNAIKDLKKDLNFEPLTIISIVSEWYKVHYLQDKEYDGNGLIYNEDDVELDEFCDNYIHDIISSN
jgi:hypothetical protein